MFKNKCFQIPLLLLSLLSFSQQSFAEFSELYNFGQNPGNLKATYFAPKGNKHNSHQSSLVVLLHGCAQKAEDLAQQSGLLGLAKKNDFALLLPQQVLSNNIKYCFNWYSGDDYTKDKGETLSIKNMITTLKQKLGSEKVFIIGLSAGGAMASSILINYPEIFTAGAVVAGIPFPCADGLITGISCMKNGPSQTSDELLALIRKIQPSQSQWPNLSVWTGEKDSIVNPLNSSVLAEQWAKLSKANAKPSVIKKSDYTITHWQNNEADIKVELVEVKNLDHGIMVNSNVENGGEVSSYLLESPLSTAKHVIEFWQL